MGCGGSKAVAAVQPVLDPVEVTGKEADSTEKISRSGDGRLQDAQTDGPTSNGHAADQPDANSTALNSPSPPAEVPQLKPLSPPDPPGLKQANGTGSAVAFEIPLESGESLIQRHPPKRFHRLEDNQLTMEVFKGKHAEAADRRNKLLNQRVQSARARNLRSAGRAKSRSTMRSDEDTIEGGVDDAQQATELS